MQNEVIAGQFSATSGYLTSYKTLNLKSSTFCNVLILRQQILKKRQWRRMTTIAMIRLRDNLWFCDELSVTRDLKLLSRLIPQMRPMRLKTMKRKETWDKQVTVMLLLKRV